MTLFCFQKKGTISGKHKVTVINLSLNCYLEKERGEGRWERGTFKKKPLDLFLKKLMEATKKNYVKVNEDD